ncbi:MAG: SRPBCC family protein [bacterium]
MKIIKGILITIGAIVVLFFVVALFLPASSTLERTIEINKPPEVVFGQVVDFNNYLKWNPWSEREPTAKNTITGEAGTVGSSWAWEGEEIGAGSLTIEKIEPNQSIHSAFVSKKPFEGTASVDWTFQATDSGTKVTWQFTGKNPYPTMRYMGLMVDGMLGPQLEKGLANLKIRCEALPDQEVQEEGTEDNKSGTN